MSSLHHPAPAWFERLAFVLVRPSHPGNVGAVARAMCTMGLYRLIVVAPRDPGVLEHPEAVARASGAAAVLQAARIAASLSDALGPFTLAVAVSAAEREFGPAPAPPEQIVPAIRSELARSPQAQVALVFGTERTGLTIEDTLPCQLMCSIPGEPGYNSLNLAQAAQILAYCLRAAERIEVDGAQAPEGGLNKHEEPGHDEQGRGEQGRGEQVRAERGEPAALGQLEQMFEHLEAALIRIGFIDPAHPKKLMLRLRRLFGRTRVEVEEVAILRGVCTQIIKLADGDIHAPSRPRDAPGPASRLASATRLAGNNE